MSSSVELRSLATFYAAVISKWLQGKDGIETLRLLGNIIPDDFTTNEKIEHKRIEEINADSNKLAWIIIFEDEPVGVAEVDLRKTLEIDAPHVSFFIGAKDNRGNGIGFSALNLLIKELHRRGYKEIHGRALTRNIASQKVMKKSGFVGDGIIYTDSDGLIWQNYALK